MKFLKTLFLVILFAALTALGAYIKIPIQPVPVTLQVFFALLSGALLGAELGALSQVLYLLAGLLGLPVFAFGGGLTYVLQPTFGYLIGYVLAAYVVGRMLEVKATTSTLRGLFSLTMIILIISISFVTIGLLGEGRGPLIMVRALFFIFIVWALYLLGVDALRRLSEYTSMIEGVWIGFSMLIGLLVVYLFGVSYLFFNANLILMKPYSAAQALFSGMGRLLPWDLIKLVVAAYLAKEFRLWFKQT